MNEMLDAIIGKLKESGYKFTPQRRIILDVVLNEEGKHLSTEEIYDIVKAKHPEIGLATVYRTLQLFSDLGVLSKLNLDDGCVRYEMNYHEDDHQHHHLICSNCGEVTEVVVDLLDALESEIEKNHQFKIQDHKVKFFGLCKKCQEVL